MITPNPNPFTETWRESMKEIKHQELRDHFAGLALQGILACDYSTTDDPAILAYQYADAMMKARE